MRGPWGCFLQHEGVPRALGAGRLRDLPVLGRHHEDGHRARAQGAPMTRASQQASGNPAKRRLALCTLFSILEYAGMM